MSQTRLPIVAILGLTTVTAAGLAVYQYQRAEALTAELNAAAMTAQPTLVPASRPPVAFTPAANSVESAPADAAMVADKTAEMEGEIDETDSPADRDRGRRDVGNRFAALMADPEFAEAFQLQQRSRLDRNYADLFAQLNLPPDTLAKLQDLLVEKQNTTRDVFMAAREEGLGRDNREELRELMQVTQAEIDAEIVAAIGESNFQTLQTYEQTGSQRALVDQLETRLSYSSAPLNSAQSQALTMILAETTSGGGNRGGFGGGGGGVQITDAALNRAQAVLSPNQLQALSTLQQEQQAGQKISEAMRTPSREGGNDRGPGRNSAGRPGPGGGG